MLEIASQMTLCLLIAALIGFIIGFIVAKATTKKPETQKPTKEEKVTTDKESFKQDIETFIETISEEDKEVETPTTDIKEVSLEEVETEEKTLSPEILAAPRDNKKDPLTQIKGIGPKVEEQLNQAGIYHFEQIANWSEENIQWLEVNTTFAHRAKKDLWVKQAKALI
jgi:NADH-quinone oxidoreductase subunit E